MNQETANLFSLGEIDKELHAKIVQDIEQIVATYLARNAYEVGTHVLGAHAPQLERLALRALKNHFMNASNIY